MHRLFTNENLVHEICSHASRSQLAVLTRVSSTWFRCAVSHLYKDVLIWYVLELLARKGQKADEIAVKSLTEENFKRLSKYTPYVRTLSMNQYCVSTLLAVMRNRASKGTQYIFPNLRHLHWIDPDDSSRCRKVTIGLLSPKVEELSIEIDDDEDPILEHFCPVAMTHLSTLRSKFSLTFECSPHHSEYVKPVQILLTHFAHTLTSVEVTLAFITPSMVECLSKMPNLCNLTFGQYFEDDLKLKNATCGDHSDNTMDFPSLRSVLCNETENPETFYDMFLKPYGLSSLTILSLEDRFTPDNVRILVSSIVATCPRIRSLALGDEHRMWTEVDSVAPWSFIEPLSCCKELISLSVYHLHISVHLDELAEFLKNRKTWTRLHILTPNARLQDMLLYAEYCPNLEHLGIHVANPDGFCMEDLPSDLPTFLNLTSICFPGDTIKKSNSHTIAQFLGRISKKPPEELAGFDRQIRDDVLKNLANFYIEEQCRTGTLMSSEVKKFVEEKTKN